MTLDFQQVHEQVRQLGESAVVREQRLLGLRERACQHLADHAQDLEELCRKIQDVVRSHDPGLRCAMPVSEPLDAHYALPQLPAQATVLAADGSQIAPDRHAEVEFGLINVGVICMDYGSPAPPVTTVHSHLFYDEELYTSTGMITDALLALRRDLNERTLLARLASQAALPAITFTDGLMEIWGGQDVIGEEATEFQKSLAEYLEVLSQMRELSVTTAGYVDKPGTNLVVRLLEVAMTPESELPDIRKIHPLRGVYDVDLYRDMLGAGERSPVFAVQSPSLKVYTGPLALHFFYLNVGRDGHPWLARVEIPAWVAEDRALVDNLQAVLYDQCRTLGARPYPYLLHRAHETAVVTLEEKQQIIQMIAQELRRRGVRVGQQSQKQANKELAGRTRFQG
jgi:hypothetical protein